MLSADLVEAQRFRDVRARLAQLSPTEAAPLLREMAQRVRRDDLQMICRAALGHIGGDFSVIDILVTLYAAVLNIDLYHQGEQQVLIGRGSETIPKTISAQTPASTN